MTECCSTTDTNEQSPRKYRCPINGQEYCEVHLKTLLHHVRQPWASPIKVQGYYFCSDPECEVVYYGEDGSIFSTSEVRTEIGIKEIGEDQLVCYCFGITKQEAKLNQSLKQYVAEKTKESLCSCESRNPSGRCCLGDFP